MMGHRGALILTAILTLGWMGVIFAFSSQSGAESSETSGQLMQLVVYIIEPEFDTLDAAAQQSLQDTVSFFVRKGAHFTEYLILGSLLFLLFYQWKCLQGFETGRLPSAVWRRLLLTAWLAATIYAGTDEFHQMFSDGRAPMIRDVCIDSAGAAAGVLVAAAVLVWRQRILRKAQNSAKGSREKGRRRKS